MARRYITDDDGLMSITGGRSRTEPVFCEWHTGCTKRATTTRPHPALGDVPVCKRAEDGNQ